MKKTEFDIWDASKYENLTYGDFIPFVTCYLHEDGIRDAMVIVPGGGYCMVAAGEAEPVAVSFFEKGYNCFVVSYTVALFSGKQLYKQPLRDLAKAVAMIRKDAAKYGIDPAHLSLIGFSAGGHLAGSLAVHYEDPDILPGGELADVSVRPDALLLSYPVVTAGPYAHRDSIQTLYGGTPTEEQLRYASLEENVDQNTPPTFLWATVTDEMVPVENSMLFAKAMKEAGVSFELHLFNDGPHGYSVADEKWAVGDYGAYYTMRQFFADMQYRIEQGMDSPFGQPMPPVTDYEQFYMDDPKDYLKGVPNEEVAVWPTLADNWLKRICR